MFLVKLIIWYVFLIITAYALILNHQKKNMFGLALSIATFVVVTIHLLIALLLGG